MVRIFQSNTLLKLQKELQEVVELIDIFRTEFIRFVTH